MKKNNKEIIVKSINKEFDGERKKYSKKELKNMISLEDFILKYYDTYDFYVCFDNYRYDSMLFINYDVDGKSINYDRTFIFKGRFDNDIEVIKLLDEYRLDEIYLDKYEISRMFATDEAYFLDGVRIYSSDFHNRIVISISRILLKEVI